MKIGIFGYGSQGRAHALNLRDSGFNITIANKKNDKFAKQILKDGFKINSFNDVAKSSDVIFILLPDHLHKKIFDEIIFKNARKNTVIIVAHGYSLYFQEVKINKDYNWYLLAPRYPGLILREKFLRNEKSNVFFSTIFQRDKKKGKIFKNIALKLKYKINSEYKISYEEEAKLDLFIEQYLIPNIINIIEESFYFLIKKGFKKTTTLVDLHASGEISELLYKSRLVGIHQIWKKIASPTCRFGIFQELTKLKKKKNITIEMEKVLKNIQNGSFNRNLKKEFKKNLINLKNFDKKNNKTVFYKTIKKISKI
tara:strand:+ start:10690 stop:11622 length:933 start_codon:yes stop_codon:yes gene_type:complete